MSNPITEIIDMTEERFKAVAPAEISYEAEKGFAMQLLTNNAYLMKVAQENPASLAQAITNVAAIGLSLNPAEKQAYLIPRNVKEGGKWVSKVFLEPSYMGLCKLATDSGAIEWIQARCVYEKDNFIDNGAGEKPSHQYAAFSKDRGEFVGVYCIAKTRSGDYLTALMDAEEISGIMERSEAVKSFRQSKGSGGPWISDFREMAKKTVIRNAFKTWPQTNYRMAEAVHLSNENEGFEPLLTSPKIHDYTAEQKAYFDQLIEQDRALDMYVLLSTVDESVRNNLYHSFERGMKGRYQQIVDRLLQSGHAKFTEYLESMNERAAAGDDAGVIELYEELTQDAIGLMGSRLAPEVMAVIREQAA